MLATVVKGCSISHWSCIITVSQYVWPTFSVTRAQRLTKTILTCIINMYDVLIDFEQCVDRG